MFTHEAVTNEMDNLRKFAIRLTGNSCDADDLLQSTILRALEKKHLFMSGTSLFKWMSKIMYNLFVSEYRRKVKFETQYDPENYLKNESDAASQEIKMEWLKVREAMNQISPDHREILILICINGMRYQDVSKLLNIPIGTVRSRLSRARESLQAILETPAVSAQRTAFAPAYSKVETPLFNQAA